MKRSLLQFLLLLALGAALLLGAGPLYRKLAAGYRDADEVPTEPTSVSGPRMPDNGGTISAPNFTVLDGAGNEVQLSDFLGRPVVLNFWASWCGPCKQEMPGFQSQFDLQGDSVTFLMVNVTDGNRETQQTAQAFLQEQGFTFPTYYDTTLQASAAYGATSIPMTYFIDTQGYLVTSKLGILSERQLEGGLGLITVPRTYSITREALDALLAQGETPIILDVRTVQEYQAGHLENAVLLPSADILSSDAAALAEQLPDPMQKIVVYCQTGNRSARVAEHLRSLGYFAIYDLGGFDGQP